MSKYKCKCGYEFESEGIKNDYVCPNCGAKSDAFIKSEELVDVIDSMLEEVTEIETQKVISNELEAKMKEATGASVDQFLKTQGAN